MSQLHEHPFYQNIRELIEQARRQTYRAVNSIMLQTYWNIGRLIIEEEQDGKARAIYGQKLIPTLSRQLTEDFGKGFNTSNLHYMRQFFHTFPNFHAVRGELSWTHYRLLLKVQNEKARDFYILEAIENQWSTRQLDRQINSFYYERLLSSQNKKPVIREAQKQNQALQPEDLIDVRFG